MNTIQSLTSQALDDVHYAKGEDFAQITTPDFVATYPDGTRLTAPDLIGRATARTVGEANYQRNITIDSVNDVGSQNVRSSNRTLTWVKGADGSWLLAAERVNDNELSQV